MKYTPSKNETVNSYLEQLDTNLASLFFAIREAVLSSSKNLNEDIKWKNCLVYSTKKNLIQTVLGKTHISLIFFDGVRLEESFPMLEGDGNKTRTLKITEANFSARLLKKMVKMAISFYD